MAAPAYRTSAESGFQDEDGVSGSDSHGLLDVEINHPWLLRGQFLKPC